MRAAFGEVTANMLKALQDIGPMTCIEICRHLGLPKEKVGAILSRLKEASPQVPQRVHIKAYVYDAEGMRRYPRAVYTLGPGKHAKKPKSDIKANRRRYEDKKKRRVNSVWMLGMSRNQRKRIGIGR